MSTAATYLFLIKAPYPARFTAYLHLDGYPAGAANYFRAMLSTDEGSSAMAFLRANTEAYLLASPDEWTNTLFRYTLSDMRLVAQQRLVERQDTWQTIFDGDLLDFINNQPGPPLHRLALYPDGRVGYYSTAQIVGYVNEATTRVTTAAQEPGTPNLQSAQRRLAELKALAVQAYKLDDGELVPTPA